VGLKGFVLGFLLTLGLSACGTTKFIYRFFIFDYENNMLRGPKPSDDLKSDICSKIPDDKYKCVVMKISEFYKLKTDYEKQKERIIQLERQVSQCGK